jgi:hypothetical protein
MSTVYTERLDLIALSISLSHQNDNPNAINFYYGKAIGMLDVLVHAELIDPKLYLTYKHEFDRLMGDYL